MNKSIQDWWLFQLCRVGSEEVIEEQDVAPCTSHRVILSIQASLGPCATLSIVLFAWEPASLHCPAPLTTYVQVHMSSVVCKKSRPLTSSG